MSGPTAAFMNQTVFKLKIFFTKYDYPHQFFTKYSIGTTTVMCKMISASAQMNIMF